MEQIASTVEAIPDLIGAIEDMGQRFVLDIPVDTRVYLEVPTISLPTPKHKRLKADIKPIKVRDYLNQLQEQDFQLVKIRKTTKGYRKKL